MEHSGDAVRLRGFKETFRRCKNKILKKKTDNVDTGTPPESQPPPTAVPAGLTEVLVEPGSQVAPTSSGISQLPTPGIGGSIKNSVVSNLSASLAIVMQVGKIVEATPLIQPIGVILSEFVKVYEKVQDNHGKRDALFVKVAALAGDIAQAIICLNDNGHSTMISRFGSDLKEYERLLQNVQELLTVDHGKFVRIIKRGELGAELDSLGQKLDFFGARFRSNRLVDIQIKQDQVAGHVAEIHDAVIESKLEAWLKTPPNPDEKLANSSNVWHKSTCLWFFKDETFIRWQDYAGALLWLEGASGFGKTILSSVIVDQLFEDRTSIGSKNRGTAIGYFYFDFAGGGKQSMENALRRLVLQLSAQCANPYSILSKHYNLYNGQKVPTWDELLVLLEKLLKDLDRTYLVLDALDECRTEDHDLIVDFVQTILGWSAVRLHVLVTSQPRSIFANGFTKLKFDRIIMKKDRVSEDIKLYISHELSSNSALAPWKSKSEQIISHIVKKSAGMFRLAACLLIALSHWDWKGDWENTLNNLPDDVFGIYNRFLEPVTSEDWVYIEGIFRWIVFSATPITLDELADAVAFDFSDPAKYVYSPGRREGNTIAIPKWLEGLIVVEHNNWGKSSVALAHVSVQDYVLSEQFMAKFGRNLSAGLSHAFIARTCIYYLLHFSDHPLDAETFPNYPLSLYAARNWFYHLQHCNDRTALSTSTMLLLEGGGRQYAALNYLNDFHQPFRHSPDWSRHIPLPLYMCSHIGYTEGVQLLLDNGADANAPGGIFDGNTLQAASERGHTKIVSLLLKSGAHVNAAGPPTKPYGRALEAASYGGHLEIVCLLLEHRAGRALAAAADRGHTKTVRVLLEKRADSESGDFGSALQAASQVARTEIIHLLLDNGADINALGRFEGTALQVASEKGHVDLVRLFLRKGANVNLGGGYGGSPLQIASKNGHTEIVEFLLGNGADVDAAAGSIGSALYAASESWNPGSCGHIDIVRLLLEKGAATNVGGTGGTALGVACQLGCTEIVRLLLQHGADANAANKTGGSPLSFAARGGSLTIVGMLIEKGANIDTNTLRAASYSGHSDMMRLLLEKGANVNTADGDAAYRRALEDASYKGQLEAVRLLLEKGRDFGSALRSACSGGHMDIVKLLLNHGTDINAAEEKYGTALQVASKEGHTEIVRFLLEDDADVNAAGGEYGSALQAAAFSEYDELKFSRQRPEYDNYGAHLLGEAAHWTEFKRAEAARRKEVVCLLLEKGANVNTTGGRYGSALQAASAGGNTEMASLLLENGADINITGGKYGCAVQAASSCGHTETVRFLLQRGVDINVLGGESGSALQAASANAHTDIVEILLDRDADINAAGGPYGSALQAAAFLEDRMGRAWAEPHNYWAEVVRRIKIVRLLLKKGADINITGGKYGTALQAASGCGLKDIVQILLYNGADVKEGGGTYGSPLQAALAGGHMETAYLLLEKGADVNAWGGGHATALQLASNGGHTEMVRILLEHGADVNAAGGKYGTSLQAACGRRLDSELSPYPMGYAEEFLACSTNIVRFLLEKGADVNAAGGENGNALQIASQNGYTEIVQILREHGARPEEGVEVLDSDSEYG